MFEETTLSIFSDTHDGAVTGLTTDPQNAVQEGVLKRYNQGIEWLDCEPDIVIHTGDGWDGKDPKSKDTTQDDMVKQAMDCGDLIVMQKPKKEVILIAGTRYHVNHDDQAFDIVCAERIKTEMLRKYDREVKVSIRRKLKTSINDWFVIEARHFIGGSSIPHGRATAPLRSQAWNVLNAALSAKDKGEVPRWPDLMVFGHRHYYMAAENAWGDVVVLPAWSGLGGVYGDEICDGHVDLGLVKVTVGATKEAGWKRDKILFSAGVVPRLESR